MLALGCETARSVVGGGGAVASFDEKTVLIVDDDDQYRSALERLFRQRGYTVRTAATGAAAIASCRDEAPHPLCAVVDLRLPDQSGLEVLVELRRLVPAIRVVLTSGYASIATTVTAMRLGAVNCVPKTESLASILSGFAPVDDPGIRAQTPSLAQVEWEHIQRVLSDHNQNISEAARQLGLSRRSLQRKLQKLRPRR